MGARSGCTSSVSGDSGSCISVACLPGMLHLTPHQWPGHFSSPLVDISLAVLLAERFALCVSQDSVACLLFGVFRVLRIVLRLGSVIVIVTGGYMLADDRSGVNFDVELEVPWNAREAYVHLDSDGVYDLTTVPDVLGIQGRRPEATVVRVMLCRDSQQRSRLGSGCVRGRTGIPCRHIDMRDTSETDVSNADLSLLRRQWPDVDPGKFDMAADQARLYAHRVETTLLHLSGVRLYVLWQVDHVAAFHLDLAQLWRCPV